MIILPPAMGYYYMKRDTCHLLCRGDSMWSTLPDQTRTQRTPPSCCILEREEQQKRLEASRHSCSRSAHWISHFLSTETIPNTSRCPPKSASYSGNSHSSSETDAFLVHALSANFGEEVQHDEGHSIRNRLCVGCQGFHRVSPVFTQVYDMHSRGFRQIVNSLRVSANSSVGLHADESWRITIP